MYGSKNSMLFFVKDRSSDSGLMSYQTWFANRNLKPSESKKPESIGIESCRQETEADMINLGRSDCVGM